MAEEKKCPDCGKALDSAGLCPECEEPAPKWLVYLVYGLLALFVAGLIYRLIFP